MTPSGKDENKAYCLHIALDTAGGTTKTKRQRKHCRDMGRWQILGRERLF